MPTYDYLCQKCEHRWELFQSMKAKPEQTCPACGKKSAKRLIGTGAAVMFKGSGFYQTDYRTQSYKQGAEAEKKAAESAKSATATTAASAPPAAGAAAPNANKPAEATASTPPPVPPTPKPPTPAASKRKSGRR